VTAPLPGERPSPVRRALAAAASVMTLGMAAGTALAVAPAPASASAPTLRLVHLRDRAGENQKAQEAAAAAGQRLPLGYGTGTATEVITAVAPSPRSRAGTVQAWTELRNGHWCKHHQAVPARFGYNGLTAHKREGDGKTPEGSFSLTQAFGAYPNPGTALPYFKTGRHDWWDENVGSRDYNRHVRAAWLPWPSENLFDERPFYNYAVVIDYNTANAPGGIRQGRGSAIFLHVTAGSSTAGCVSIPQRNLLQIMKWLKPADHPRILIGT